MEIGQTQEVVVAPVGDLLSKEPGSAARFNAGKVPYDLLDVDVLAECSRFQEKIHGPNKHIPHFSTILKCLARWQHGGTPDDLFAAAETLALDVKVAINVSNLAWGGISWDDCARVFEYGSKKYCAYNWVKGQKWSVPFASALRHLTKMAGGEPVDEESELAHFGHFLANIMMLAYFYKGYTDGDDRPPFLKLP